MNDFFDWQLALWFSGIVSFIILLAGFYPAYVLSVFKPREVLYNQTTFSGRNFFGRFLVVLQFSLAVFFIIITLVYYRQMDFIRTKDLGYNPYQVIHTNIPGDRDHKSIKTFHSNEMKKQPSVKYISFGGGGMEYSAAIGNKTIDAEILLIDEFRLPVMDIRLRAGRNISSAYPSDGHNAVLVNEAFVKAAGLKSPLGTQIKTEYYDEKIKTIIGVVKDYHSGSLHHAIKPMVMLVSDWASGEIYIKIEKGKERQALAAIQAAYKKAMPGALFQYQFLDELNAREYLQEQRWQKIVSVAMILSIIICCLGLFGLAHLNAHQRIKEIGIRKVLGAKVTQIAALLSKDFLRLVFISSIIASPVARIVADNWLKNFAYRVDISWWVFVLAGIFAICIALITVSFQAIKAALGNPVESLRTE
jgi:putative ABC transport system permease protein